MTDRSNILNETTEAKRHAESLLAGLRDAKSQSQERLAKLNRTDILEQGTGKSAIDNAMASTQRMIDALDRVIEEVSPTLTDEERALLEG